MKCPIDNTDLNMMERQGIEIDYCPQCRGVWLDRGELDKLIERSASPPAPVHPDPRQSDHPVYQDDNRRAPRPGADDYYDNRSHGNYKKKKRGGFLEDMFDF